MPKIFFGLAAVSLLLIGAGCANFRTNEQNYKPIEPKKIIPPASQTETTVKVETSKVTESALVGSWNVRSGNMGFSEITLSQGATYSTFLDGRPFDDGTWTFANGVLELNSSSGDANSGLFTNTVIANGSLSMQKNGVKNIWQRLP